MDRLDLLRDYMYYFQFTINLYGQDIEANIPSKNDIIILTFRELSDMIGCERVIWRCNPILLTKKYSIDYHIRYFEEIAKWLSGYTEKCIISFVDLYRNTKNNTKDLGLLPCGVIDDEDVVKDHVVKSCKDCQMNLFWENFLSAMHGWTARA